MSSNPSQVIVVQNFDRLERRLVTLHSALIEALRNSDTLEGDLKKAAVVLTLKGYLRTYQIGLIFSQVLAEKKYFFWHGILFELGTEFDKFEDKNKKVSAVMHGVLSAVISKAADEFGSKKLGEAFKLLATEKDVKGFLNLLNFACLIRGKPNEWFGSAQHAIAATDRKALFLRSMLRIAFEQFYEEVNTGGEREELKKVIATVKIKRDLKKDHPGPRDLARIVGRLEQQDYFEKPAVIVSREKPEK
jgi:hypothetical protein